MFWDRILECPSVCQRELAAHACFTVFSRPPFALLARLLQQGCIIVVTGLCVDIGFGSVMRLRSAPICVRSHGLYDLSSGESFYRFLCSGEGFYRFLCSGGRGYEHCTGRLARAIARRMETGRRV